MPLEQPACIKPVTRVEPLADGNRLRAEVQFRTSQNCCSSLIYAHWFGQKAAEFVTACAAGALQQRLMDEALCLQAYDQARGDKKAWIPRLCAE